MCLGSLGTQRLGIGRCIGLNIFHQYVPSDEVEPALAFKHELQTAFLTQTLSELFLCQSAQFQVGSITGRVLDVEIRTPVSTTAHLVDGIIGGIRRTVQFVLSLSLDKQHLGIADNRGVDRLSGRVASRRRIGIVERVDVFAETRNREFEILTGVRIVEPLSP